MKEDQYTENERRSDYHFFVDNHNSLYEEYGNCFLAVKNGSIIGSSDTAINLINQLSDKYEPGTYSIQECNASDTVNHVRIQRMKIGV